MTIEMLTRDEASLIVYLETRLVDAHGNIDRRHMNDDDRAIVDRWANEGLIEYTRLAWEDVPERGVTHRVRFTERAWQRAHAERRNRAERYTETLP